MKKFVFLYMLIWTIALTACGLASAPPALTATLTPTAAPQITATPQPVLQAGQWSAMVYHDRLKQILLVNGGPKRGKPADDPLELWSWDGQTWILLDNSGPAWRNWAGVAYDSRRNRLVIHGGHQNGVWFDETWEWDGQGWRQFDGSAPGGREGAGMVYDSARGNVVLFGGANAALEILGDTWEWDGQAWKQVATSGPPARFPGGVGYDPIRQQVLIYGGHDPRPAQSLFFGDFWAWDGTAWQEIITEPDPGIRVATSLLFNPVRGEIMMFGGAELYNDLWTWNGTQWTLLEEQTSMPRRSGFNIVAFDQARGVYVLFGGVDRPGGEVLNETWEWNGQLWVCKTGCAQ